MDRVHEDNIALVDGHGNGGLVGRGEYGGARVVVIKGTEVVVEFGLGLRLLLGHGLGRRLGRQWRRHVRLRTAGESAS